MKYIKVSQYFSNDELNWCEVIELSGCMGRSKGKWKMFNKECLEGLKKDGIVIYNAHSHKTVYEFVSEDEFLWHKIK